MTYPLLVSFLGMAVAACGGAETDTLVVSSDPELATTASALLSELAPRSGLELVAPVRVERRSREALVDYLRFKLDEELPPDEARRMTSSYALLGLVPGDLDLRALLLSVYTEQVAAFYDPDSTALFVLDDQPLESLGTVLLHELVHAVQDQNWDLEELTHERHGNDRQTAAQAAIEGHATLVMFEYMMAQLQGGDVDLGRVDGLARQIGPALEGVRAQYPALSSAPRVIQESLLFPYLGGADFVLDLWRQGERAPFGAWLPRSTEQVLEPDRFFGPDRDHPVEVRLELEGPVLYENVLGQLEVRLLLEELGATADAGGWDGDRFALIETDGEEGLVWASVWDDSSSRDRVASALERHAGSLPRPAVVTRLDVEGRPGLLLQVGTDVDVGVFLDGASGAGG